MDDEWCGGHWVGKKEEEEELSRKCPLKDGGAKEEALDKFSIEGLDILKEVLMSNHSCDPMLVPGVELIPGFKNSAVCVEFSRCDQLLSSEDAPKTHVLPCGFSEASSQMMICCPEEKVSEESANNVAAAQAPRYPQPGVGGPRECQDKHSLCGKWKEEGGCRLDKEFILSEVDPWNSLVYSKQLFAFMATTCMATCGWCDDRGCVDEHANCVQWARNGMCVLNPMFMAHTCRSNIQILNFSSAFSPSGRAVACVASFLLRMKRSRRLLFFRFEGLYVSMVRPGGWEKLH